MVHDYPPFTGGGLALGVREIAAVVHDLFTVRIVSSRTHDHYADDRPRLAQPNDQDEHVCTLATPRRAIGWLGDSDLVVINWTFSFRGLSTLLLLATPLLGKPTVLIVHTAPDHVCYNRLRHVPAPLRKGLVALVAAAAHRCTAVVALSPAHADALRRVGFPVTRVVPLPVAIERYRTALDRRHDRPIRTVLILGELSRLKGADAIPHLLPFLTSTFAVRIVGRGPLAELVTTAAATLSHAQRVVISEPVEPSAVPRVLDEVDCVLVLSRSESQCRVVLEAMLSGVVVLARGVGGICDLVSNDRATGFLIDPDEPEAVYKTLLLLANDLAEAGRVRKCAFEHARHVCTGSRSGWRRLLVDASTVRSGNADSD
jgi:glycosyltransferase involved in cell wall biosynthesis